MSDVPDLAAPPHFSSSQGPVRADHSVGRSKVFHNTFYPPTRRPSSGKPGRPTYSSETYPGTAYDVAFGSTVQPKKKPNITFRRSSTEKKSMVSPSASTPKLSTNSGARSTTPKATVPSPSSRSLIGIPTPKRSSTSGSPLPMNKPSRSLPTVSGAPVSGTPPAGGPGPAGAPAGAVIPGSRASRPSTPQRLMVGDKVNITVQSNIINFEVDLNQAKGPEIAASMFEALGIGMPSRTTSDTVTGSHSHDGSNAPAPVMSRSPSGSNDRKNRWMEQDDAGGFTDNGRDISPASQSGVVAGAPAVLSAPLASGASSAAASTSAAPSSSSAAATSNANSAAFGGGRYLALDMLNAKQLEYLARLGYTQADFTDDPMGKNSTIKRRPGRPSAGARARSPSAHVDDAPEVSVDYEIQQIQKSHARRSIGRPQDNNRERNVMAPAPVSRAANSRDVESPDGSPALRQFSNTIPPLDLRFANIASPRGQLKPADALGSHRSDIGSPDPLRGHNGLHVSRGSAFSNRSSQASSRSTTSVNSTASRRHQRPSTDDGGTSDTSSSRDQSDL